LQEVRKYYPDWQFTEIGIDKGHGHVHMVIPPKYSVSFAVETIKKNTRRRLREKFRFLDKMYWDRGGIWSTGYFVSTVELRKRSSGGTSLGKERKMRDKSSLNSKRTLPVKSGESISVGLAQSSSLDSEPTGLRMIVHRRMVWTSLSPMVESVFI
jgi:hypothetical protein